MPNFRIKHLLAACFLVSGATSLVLEVAWAQELSYVLGNSLYAVSTVIGAFMAGLALGAFGAGRWLDRLERPILAYALLEFAIAVFGFFSISVLRATPDLYAALYQSGLSELPALFFVVRFSVLFGLMMVPTTLMGMTLPLVAGAYSRAKRDYDLETGLLYGINTLGAVLGTLLAGFVLIPELGLWQTCAVVGVTDALVGGVALFLNRAVGPFSEAPEDAAPRASERGHGAARRIGLLYLLSGAVAIVLEVMWFRYLVFVFGPTANAFSVMLAIFLVGVSLGSAAAAPLARRSRDPSYDVARLQFALALLVVATTVAYNALPELYGSLYFRLSDALGLDASALAQGIAGSIVVLPATFVMGALFPFTLRVYREAFAEHTHAEQTVGRLYALNTVGGILGSFAAGFWILPHAGIWNTGIACAAASVLVGVAFVVKSPRSLRARAVLTGTAFAGCLLFALLAPRLDLLAMNKGSFMALRNPTGFASMMTEDYDKRRSLLFYREGLHISVGVTRTQGNLYLRLAGRPAADTTMAGRAHLVLLGQLPALFADAPRRVAVVGYGAGMSTGASLTHPSVERVDVLELEPGVVEASKYFAYLNGDALEDPRTHIRLDDGRTSLAYSQGRYDVITSDAISPLAAGAANLYTTDYFEIAKARLADDGIFCQWIETYIPSEDTFKGIVASIRHVFPHVALFVWGPDVLMLGSKQPIRVPWTELTKRTAVPAVRDNLALLEVRSAVDLLTLYLGGTPEVDAYLGPNPRLITDDDNWLGRQMPYDLNRREPSHLPEILAREFAGSRAESMARLSPGVPLDEIARATALPAHPMLALHRDIYTRGFLSHYQRQG
ncbi:MAG: fused MFS/spermidine synthase, partial [Myxococcota bacterium]